MIDCLKHPVGRMTPDKWAECLAAEAAAEEADKSEELPAPPALSDSECSHDADGAAWQ